MTDRGHIFKRGGSWIVDIYVDGERIRRSAGKGATKHDANRLLESLRREALLGRDYVSLHEVFVRYEHSMRAKGRKTKSIDQATHHFGHLERIIGGATAAWDVSDDDLERFITARRDEGVTNHTINASLKYLKAALRNARIDPPCRIQRLKVLKKRPQVLSRAQIQALLDEAGHPYDTMILIAADVGLRHREILHLSVADVDLSAGVIHVTAKKWRTNDGAQHVWTPKDDEERSIVMPKRLRRQLEGHVKGLTQNSPEDWLFPGRDGGPVGTANRAMRTIFKAAGLYDLDRRPGLHMLRKSCATEMLGRGVDVETVREVFGWADLATPMAYLTTTGERMRAAAAVMDDEDA